ncbi:metal-binding protein [Synechococcus sp. NOUM97013]|uniref:metal-binding protein n=1 Tax=Synechococcus sp. NOUM97013 TaxID=1442555 RepID=UPI00164961C9|nr:metal-binding protein [Synechococcus sp. NOUM97013]QNI74888.1 hypothetical protein SynNOUM97013_02855 [Synechococcus sp. NOUM97013]
MACGRDHDRATAAFCIPIWMITSWWLGWSTGSIAAVSFLVGGLWLSPDLDVQSRALKRWGLLAWIWWPYRRLVPHRSLWSHGPVIGMTVRLAWILLLLGLAWTGLAWIVEPTIPTPLQAWPGLLAAARQHPHALWGALLGLEGSVWLHLLLDGDPLPAEWPKRWRRRRQR